MNGMGPASVVWNSAAPPKGKEDADEHHYGRNVEDVESDFRDEGSKMKAAQRNAKHERAINALVVRSAFEPHPSER